MKFEISTTKFLGKWHYQVQFAYYFDWVPVKGTNDRVEKWRSKNEARGIADIEQYLTTNALGAWERNGNSFYVTELDDAFKLRLFFDQNLKAVRQYQEPQSYKS